MLGQWLGMSVRGRRGGRTVGSEWREEGGEVRRDFRLILLEVLRCLCGRSDELGQVMDGVEAKWAHGHALVVPESDVGPVLDQPTGGVDALDGEERRLALVVGDVDVPADREEVGQERYVGVRGGGVPRRPGRDQFRGDNADRRRRDGEGRLGWGTDMGV